MIETLKFVQGATTRKGLVQALSHFRIKGGWITGFNGTMALSAPISVGMDICPHADQFVSAIDACDETVALSMARNEKLLVRAGKFQTHIDCLPLGDVPVIASEGRVYNVTDNIIPALAYLEPFIAEDASRPWACGILFDGESAYATNNIVLQEYWLGYSLPFRVNIPRQAVLELLRIGKSPSRIRVSETSISFEFPDGRWLRTQLLEKNWPDIAGIFKLHENVETKPFPKGFFEACKKIEPFTDALGKVYLLGEGIATMPDPSLSGTVIDAPGLPSTGCYNVRQLLKLEPIANRIAFDAYPGPVMFYGEASRGIIVGMRV